MGLVPLLVHAQSTLGGSVFFVCPGYGPERPPSPERTIRAAVIAIHRLPFYPYLIAIISLSDRQSPVLPDSLIQTMDGKTS